LKIEENYQDKSAMISVEEDAALFDAEAQNVNR
jgi:hypothetical protein